MRRDHCELQTLESVLRSASTAPLVDRDGHVHTTVSASRNGCVLRRVCDDDLTSHSYGSPQASEECGWTSLDVLRTLSRGGEFRPELCYETGMWDVTLVLPGGPQHGHGGMELRWSSLPTRDEASQVCVRLNSARRS